MTESMVVFRVPRTLMRAVWCALVGVVVIGFIAVGSGAGPIYLVMVRFFQTRMLGFGSVKRVMATR